MIPRARRLTPLRCSVLAALLVVALASPFSSLLAGGPRAVNGDHNTMFWPWGIPVVYNPDPGPLGLLNNAAARQLLAQAFAEWEEGPSSISFTEGPLLDEDVDGFGFAFTNPAHFRNFYRVNGDGLSPVIFDHDGSIIETLFGIGARYEILGVAAIDNPIAIDPELTGASIIINGAFYDGIGPPESPEDVTLLGLKAAMVHEIGHFINLDHTVLNHEQALDDNPSNDIYVPTMFPIAVQDEEALADINPDDEFSAVRLYPPGSIPEVGIIRGSITMGGVPFQGANVVFRRTDDPLMRAWSFISGAYHFPCNPGSQCDPCNTSCDPGNPPVKGLYVFTNHFDLGQMTVCVEQIDTRFSAANDTFVGPLATPPILPGPEECYDASESGTQGDDPDNAALVVPVLLPTIDIDLNALPSSDPFEPNNTMEEHATLEDLEAGQDTAPAVMGAGDLDVFEVPVTAGQVVRIDIDAREHGSALDAVVGFYDNNDILVVLSDDAIDPDSKAFSVDPALEIVADFTGTANVAVSSFPDLDQDGVGGGSTGGYWIRVQVVGDTDADGTLDDQDVCTFDPRDDTDRDSHCFDSDNCSTIYNPAQLEPTKLNGTLTPGGDAGGSAFVTPNGARVVYLADQDTDDVFELYSVPPGGGTVTKLNAPVTAGGDVQFSLGTADSAWVIYFGDPDTDGVNELYSVPTFGGTVNRLNGALTAGGNVIQFRLPANSSRVVYDADQDTDQVLEVYSVPIGGGVATKLNGPLVTNGDTSGAWVSEDSATVVYRADQDVDTVTELYSVPIGGGTPVKLNAALVSGGDVGVPVIAQGLVVYPADQDVDGQVNVYSVPIGGGSPVRLNQADTIVSGFAATPDSSRVIFRAFEGGGETAEIWSVPITGGSPTKLNGTIVSGGSVISFVPSPDSTKVVYIADQDTDSTNELYSVPIDGGTPVKLNTALPMGGNVISFTSTKDGMRVVYRADQVTDEVFELFSAPIDGGPVVRLNLPPVLNGDVFQNFITTDDAVFYQADQDTDEVFEIYRASLTGGEVLKLSAPMAPAADAGSFHTSDGTVLAYQADHDTDEQFEVYSVDARTGSDTDADGVLNACDSCRVNANSSQTDADDNGVGDACQVCTLGTDPDGDGVCGNNDNCPTIDNPGQDDFEGDGFGDACDTDDDNDGLIDSVETNTGNFVDSDDTGTDPLDSDTDEDGVTDGEEVAAGTDPNLTEADVSDVPFHQGRLISGTAATSVVFSDMDGDGDQDVLSAQAGITWHENDGGSPPQWTTRTIGSFSGFATVFASDVDGDGDMDALRAADGDNLVVWYQNDGASPPAWTARTISSTANFWTSVSAADVDGDGDMDVLTSSNGGVIWHENDGASPPVWTDHTIFTGAFKAVFADDVDRDGNIDVLATNLDQTIRWFESDGASPPGWTARSIAGTGAGGIFAADVDGDGDRDVLTSAGLGQYSISWAENDGASPPGWTDRMLESFPVNPLSITAADIDADGDVDALATGYYNPGTIEWYENRGGSPPVWTRRPLVDGVSGPNIRPYSAVAADADGDGDIDVVAACELAGVVWYENRSMHRNAAFPLEVQLSTGFVNGIVSLASADLDGDGDQDAVSASYFDDRIGWYENVTPHGPGEWTERTITVDVANGARWVQTGDLDRDGDIDVLSASWDEDEDEGKVAWYENSGASPPAWFRHTVQTGAFAAFAPNSVFAADVNGDGLLDILASAAGAVETIAWHPNTGSGFGSPETIHSEAGQGVQSLFPADVDDDGDLDVLSASHFGNKVAWYENLDGLGLSWSARTISGPTGDHFLSVFAADLDDDGDLDALATANLEDKISWYENDGTPGNGAWTVREIGTVDSPSSVIAFDVDGDGDLDALATGTGGGAIAWYENDGASPPAWTAHPVPTSLTSPWPIVATDVDGDGLQDILCAGAFDGKIAWYENRGGQFTLKTTATAPLGMLDGSVAPLLRVDLTSNGRAGDSAVELSTLVLNVYEGGASVSQPGPPLSTDEANALIERLTVNLDDGSNAFEPDDDLPVAALDTLAFFPQGIIMTPGDPRVRVAPGETRSFFIAAGLTVDASAQSPSEFHVVHGGTGGGSSARDAVAGTSLTMEHAPDVFTLRIAPFNDTASPFVTGVFPVSGTVDVALSTNVVLFFSEPMDPDTVGEGVALYAAGVKVPATVSASGRTVSINPAAELAVNTDYLVQVTPAARDLGGNPGAPFISSFDTAGFLAKAIDAGDIGESGGGATVTGSNADDNSGFATAALGDVNATAASGGIADLIIGAPNADAGAVDAGNATLVFGSPTLQSNIASSPSIIYRTATAADHVGETVAQAGDVNRDGIRDFLIGAPHSDQTGADAGVVYLVFGNTGLDELSGATLDLDSLASCSVPTLCGVKFTGAAPGDLAGASLSWAGDIDGDLTDDILIGAPGASPGSRAEAGSVYLIFGPLPAGTIDLADVGSSVRGQVFNGESDGDHAGAAVSQWRDQTGDGLDDLLIGAPGADALNQFGVLIADAGYVYAIQGGLRPGHLDDTATPGIIELSRVASGDSDQVAGMVFLGDTAGGSIGRSLTGAVDVDGDGVMDILVTGDGVAFLIPGDDPKTITGATPTPGTGGGGSLRAGLLSAVDDFHAIMFTTGNDDPLTVGAAGDLDNDGYDDFIIGSPLADGPAGTDAGRAYIVLGSPALGGEVIDLDDVGDVIAGLIVEGAAPGDNLGASVGGGHDVNADGVDDALAGAPFADTDPATPVDAGETYVISLLRPEEVVSLMLYPTGGGVARLEWSVPDQGATYNVYSGLISGLQIAGQVKTSNMTKLACGISADADADLLPDYDDSGPLPPFGDVRFYLVTASNFQGEGPLGPPGAQPQRINDAQCP